MAYSLARARALQALLAACLFAVNDIAGASESSSAVCSLRVHSGATHPYPSPLPQTLCFSQEMAFNLLDKKLERSVDLYLAHTTAVEANSTVVQVVVYLLNIAIVLVLHYGVFARQFANLAAEAQRTQELLRLVPQPVLDSMPRHVRQFLGVAAGTASAAGGAAAGNNGDHGLSPGGGLVSPSASGLAAPSNAGRINTETGKSNREVRY